MRTVAELMTRDVITLSEDSTLADARAMVAQRNIRHVPVVNKDGRLTGILSQRIILSVALNTADTVGLAKLAKIEARTRIGDVMEPISFTGTEDMKLSDAARFFLDKKTSVLCILKDDQVVGIVSAYDFVKLAISMLEAEEHAG